MHGIGIGNNDLIVVYEFASLKRLFATVLSLSTATNILRSMRTAKVFGKITAHEIGETVVLGV
jgi:hypothetical protein